MSLDRRALGGPGKPRGPRGHPRAVALQDRPRRRAGPAEPPHRRDRQSRGPESAALLGLPCTPLRGVPPGPAPTRGGRTGRPRSDARAPGTGSGSLERSPDNSVPLPHGCPPVSCRRTGKTERGSGVGVSPRRSIPPRPRVSIGTGGHPAPRGERSSVPAARSSPGRAEPLSAAWDRVCRRRPPTVARSAAPSGPPHLRPQPLRYLAAPDAPRRRRPAGAAPGARGSPVPPWCRRCRRCDAERGGAGWRTGEGPAGPARRKQRAVNHRTHPGDTGGRPAAAPARRGHRAHAGAAH